MARALSYNEGGRTFLIEIESADTLEVVGHVGAVEEHPGVVPGMEPAAFMDRLPDALRDLGGLIVASARTLKDVLESVAGPSSIELELGVKFVGELGLPMITKSSGEAAVKVTVKWTKDPNS